MNPAGNPVQFGSDWPSARNRKKNLDLINKFTEDVDFEVDIFFKILIRK